jgi:predicted nuclease of restriction endonuclease-like (RecB) superfamily
MYGKDNMEKENKINSMDVSFGEDERGYQELVEKITVCHNNGRAQALRSINDILTETNWNNGRYIVEYEQGGKARAKYGARLMERLSRDLTIRLGKGFSHSNLHNMRSFYLHFPILQKVSGKLSWSHYCELIMLGDEIERDFYFNQSILENWSVNELKRQKKTGLFLRLAASKNKDEIMKLSARGRIIEKPLDVVNDVYVLDFLKIPEPYVVNEQELETRIINDLQLFLLELGKGFTFVGRQYRITLGNVNYRVDLVFYHRILRCFVLIDLKVDNVQHYDIGQMNMYMGYFAAEENGADDNPPIGIILSRDKDELLVKYATYEMNSQLFVSKYQQYLPDKEELRKLLYENLNAENEGIEG